MFSIVWKSQVLKFPAVIKLTQQFNRFSLFPSLCHINIRDIQEKSHGESGSLTHRFIKYIALENCKVDPLIKTKIKYSQLYPMHNIMDFSKTLNKIDVDQLPKLVIYTYTYKTNGDPLKVVQVINEIDKVCCKSLLQMSNSEILRTLYSFMYLIPNKITKLNFYGEAMESLIEKFDTKQSKQDFVQICYYLGLAKKNKKSANLLKEFLDMFLKHYMKEFNTMDLAIVSNATFKASLPYANEEFQKYVKDETLNLANNCTDDSVLITFIKFLRLNRIEDNEIYEKLGKLIQKHSAVANFQFKGLVHIFAYFAVGLWNDQNISRIIIDECMQRIKEVGFENYLFNDMRSKDLATFFWSCATIGAQQFDRNDLNFIERLLLNKLNKNEFDYCADEYIDMVLSLWMLGLKSEKLIIPIQKQFIDVKSRKPHTERFKLNSRLDLLLNCVYLEFPNWLEQKLTEKIFDENRKCPEFLLKNNPDILNVMKCLNENLDEFKINNLKLILPIKEINIPSIHLEIENGNKYFLVVLNQVLKFNKQPTAIVSLKIKLLEGLGCNVITMNGQDSESPVDFLKSKIVQLSEMKKINKAVV